MRQIKRTRQIEDFVIEKLARRGLITEKDKENSVAFVKGLQMGESINQLLNRKLRTSDQALLNESTNFTTELAAAEFSRLCALDIGYQWFEEVKQIVQIHFCYKALAEQGPLELIRSIIRYGTTFGRADHIKHELEVFIGEQEDCIDSEKLKKDLLGSKSHQIYRQQKHEILIDENDFEQLLLNIAHFPLTFSVLAGAIDISYMTIEEDVKSNGDSDPPPLTPPEIDSEPNGGGSSTEMSVLVETMESSFKAVSGTPIAPTFVWLTKVSLPHDTTACSSAIHPHNNHLVAVGRSDSIVTCFAGPSSKSAKQVDLIGHSRPVWSLAWGQSATLLYSGGADKSINVWEIDSTGLLDAKLAATFTGHSFGVTDLAISPFDLYFASASADTSARLWSLERPHYIRMFAGHNESVNCVAFHPNCNYLFSGGDDRSIRLWDINTGKCQRTYFMTNSGAYKCSVRSIDVSPDGKRIAASYDDGVIRVFDIAEQRLEGEYFTDHRANNDIVKVKYNSNGTLLASISDDTIRVWSQSCEILMLKPKSSQMLTSLSWKGVSSLTVTGF